MKVKILLIAFLAIIFVGCAPKDQKDINIFEKELIVYSGEDTQDKVTSSFSLVTELEGITINWASSNINIIEIDGTNAKVTRTNQNEFVTLTASYVLNDVISKKNFFIVILADETGNVDPEVDTTPPEIRGVSNLEIYLGSELDLLDYVEAIDDKDGEVEVTIKENNLDVENVGNYIVIFEAKDSSNNKTTFTMNISIIIKEEKQTYIEDFNKLPETSSVYKTYSFVGNHDIVWQVTGSRGDQILDGAALTFGGSTDDYSSIQTKLSGGISFFRVELKKGFTNTNPRHVGIFINDDLVEEFIMNVDTLDVQVFEVELDVFGEYTLELAQIDPTSSRAQIIIDNIKIVNNPKSTLSLEEQNLNRDFDSLEIQTSFIEAGNISLPSTGFFSSKITWKYTNTSGINNNLVNLETKTILMPATGIKDVQIDAVITNGTYTKVKTFTIKIGEGDPVNINQIHNFVDGSKVKIQGVISNVFEVTTGKRAFIQDGSSGVLIYLDSKQNVSVGDEYQIIATKKSSSGVVYLDSITKLEQKSTKTLSPILITNQDLSTLNGKLVNLSGLLKFSYGKVNTFTLVNVHEEYNVFIKNDLVNLAALQATIDGKATGIEVDLFGVVYLHAGEYVVYLTTTSDIEVETVVDKNRVDEVIHAHLDFPVNNSKVSSNLHLFTETGLFIDTTITWSSSNPSLLNNHGVIYPIDEDANVVLTYKIYINNNLISTHNISLVIGAKSEYSGYYARIQGLSGQALKSELSSIISNMKSIGYSSTSYVLEDADVDPNKAGQLLLIYDRRNIANVWRSGSGWNKEHIWPQSKLGGASKSDIHNLRASDPGVNSRRGNLAFAQGSGSYGPVSGGWYPGDQDKGDVARIVLYMNVRWGLQISSGVIGNLEMFKRWHLEDPVDEFEINRNQVIYENQNNRNPFIDHPELVEEIFGTITLSSMSVEENESVSINIYNINYVNINYYDLLDKRFV